MFYMYEGIVETLRVGVWIDSRAAGDTMRGAYINRVIWLSQLTHVNGSQKLQELSHTVPGLAREYPLCSMGQDPRSESLLLMEFTTMTYITLSRLITMCRPGCLNCIEWGLIHCTCVLGAKGAIPSISATLDQRYTYNSVNTLHARRCPLVEGSRCSRSSSPRPAISTSHIATRHDVFQLVRPLFQTQT